MKNKSIAYINTHYVDDPQYGGVVEATKNIHVRIENNQFFDVHLYATSGRNVQKRNGVSICKSPFFKRWGFSPKIAWTILKDVNKYDLFYVNGIVTFPCTIACYIALVNGKPYGITLRGGLEEWRINQFGLIKRIYIKYIVLPLLNRAKFIHCTSEDEIKSSIEFVSPNKYLIPNGVRVSDTDLIQLRTRVINRFEKHTKIKMLFFSRLSPEKGLNLLMEVFVSGNALIRENFELSICGPDPYRMIEKWRNEIKNFNIRVHEPIYGDERFRFIEKFDLMVLPSYSENFGNVIAESIYCGVPYLTSTGTPWRKYKEFKIGLIFDKGSSVDLERALLEFLATAKEDVAEMVCRATRFSRENLSWSKRADQITEMLIKELQ